MDGRKWAVVAAAGLAAAAGGCSTPAKTTSGMPIPAQAKLPGQGESRWAKLFGPPAPPGPPAPAVTASSSGKKKTGVSAETQVTFAQTQLEAAFMDGQENPDELIDRARQRFQKVLDKDPKNVEALKGLAELYTRARDRDRALPAYQRLVEADPKNHDAAHAMALACGSFDEWPSAVQAVEYALALDPENRRYHKTYGKCLAWAGQTDKGLEALAKVMPAAEAHYTLARVLVEGGQEAAGRQHLELAAKADPGFAPAKEALARLAGGGAASPVVQTAYPPAGN